MNKGDNESASIESGMGSARGDGAVSMETVANGSIEIDVKKKQG